VNARKIRSSNPGFCFQKAGWQLCGITKARRLHILFKMPDNEANGYYETFFAKKCIFEEGLKNPDMMISVLESVIKGSWDSQTCFPSLRRKWSEDRPAVGQCAVTALLIQDQFGGDIGFNKSKDHFFNILPSGQVIDLTLSQFNLSDPLQADEIKSRDYILYSEAAVKYKTRERYELLRKRVLRALGRDLLLVEKVKQAS